MTAKQRTNLQQRLRRQRLLDDIKAHEMAIINMKRVIERLDTMPNEPLPDTNGDGPVIFFRKQYGRKRGFSYQYVALRIDIDSWWLSGKNQIELMHTYTPNSPMTWQQLIEFITVRETTETMPDVWLASEWELLHSGSTD